MKSGFVERERQRGTERYYLTYLREFYRSQVAYRERERERDGKELHHISERVLMKSGGVDRERERERESERKRLKVITSHI
jgi:hypothetical protein